MWGPTYRDQNRKDLVLADPGDVAIGVARCLAWVPGSETGHARTRHYGPVRVVMAGRFYFGGNEVDW
jgi:hypothetical protein